MRRARRTCLAAGPLPELTVHPVATPGLYPGLTGRPRQPLWVLRANLAWTLVRRAGQAHLEGLDEGPQ